ncbi:MAG: VWA domain-containing protein [Bacteroidales bacterium]|nr:VWA domain-containing protein [Bacteroidales bacterium]
MNLFQFKNPEYFWLFLLIPFFIVLYISANYFRKKTLKRFGDSDLIQKLFPDYSKYRILFKNMLIGTALIFMIIAAARPQSGNKVKVQTTKNREIIFALDVSSSMLAQDVKPNRLYRAKQIISELYRKNPYDRMGLIIFAGEAFVQIPLTSNFSNSDIILSSISPDIIPVQGTNISSAINLAANMFDKTNTESQKFILILTDGENHEQKAIDAAKEVKKSGIIISTVGIGKKSAVPIPEPQTGEYKKDKNGKVVLTKLNEVLLTQIANAGGGKYYDTGNFYSDINRIQHQINSFGEKGGKTEVMDYADLFPYFIFIAFLLLILEFIFLERRNQKLTNLKIFK